MNETERIPSLLSLYSVLEDFRVEDTDFEALASYYEHHYRVQYGSNVILDQFILLYFLDPHTINGNIIHYWIMIYYLEELKREHATLCIDVSLSPETPTEQQIWRQHLEYLRLQNTVQSHLLQLGMTFSEKEKKLQEAAHPPVGERLTLRKRVRKAIMKRLQRVWVMYLFTVNYPSSRDAPCCPLQFHFTSCHSDHFQSEQ
ncbi:uncharacterized protein LOC121394118 [Xenopus laevis]|uniref:Uncharacterized protein LOC121394118 n=1 Tax=Xenopus laevis TaxID=8355 RepID=A0A8J1KTI1_XENLA|nr:uncharacterized protein LOC121394118 [Xenopus laevis]